jgi:hypothetical protein
MAAYPFQRHPTFREYLESAIRAGCTVTTGVGQNDDGRPVSVTITQANNGKKATEVDTQLDEFLVPTTVARLDRRLGIRSPFATTPDHP